MIIVQLLILTFSISNYKGQQTNQISLEGIGSYLISGSFSELTSELSNYEQTEIEGILHFHQDKSIYLTAWTYEGSDRIRGLGTYSPEFELSNGLRVGSTIDEVLSVYPNIELEQSMETSEEYFAPDELTGTFNSKRRVIILFLDSVHPNLIGTYEQDFEYRTSNFSTEGRIARIEVYNTN